MKIEKRTESLSIVRGNKKTPGVIYGKGFESISIQADAKELHSCLSEYGLTKTFKIKLGTKSHTVYIKNIHRDILNGHHFLNFELMKVSAGDTIKASISINMIGKENIEERRYDLRSLTDTLDVEYVVGSGVSHIDVDVSGLKFGDYIYAKDIKLPKGIELLEDEDKVIISMQEVAIIPDELEESDGEPELTEPELVNKKTEE
ncbi:hypothetical protein RJI07_03325 [Mycoplasmatota bacterium WC30]